MKLGDLCEIVRGSSPRPKGDSRFYGGSIPRLMVADVTRDGKYVTPQIDSLTHEGAALSRPMQQGDLVIAVSGNPGLASILATDACIHDGFVGLRNLDESRISVDYLYRYLNFFKEQLSNQAVGAIFKNLTTHQIANVEIPLPPIAEQHRIAEILDRADAIRHKRQQAIALTEELLRSTFLDMFGNPVTNPKGWEIQPMRKVIQKIDAGWCATSEDRSCEGDEWGVLKVSAVTSGRFKAHENKVVEATSFKKLPIVPKKGDLLLSRANTRELVAATCLVEQDYERVFLSDKLWCITTYPDVATVEYLKFLLSDPDYRNLLTRKATGTSGSMLNISQAKLLEMDAPIPELVVQKRFAEFVWLLIATRAKYELAIDQANFMFNSLMQRAFRGEL